eukprot:Awhi_evm2s3140
MNLMENNMGTIQYPRSNRKPDDTMDHRSFRTGEDQCGGEEMTDKLKEFYEETLNNVDRTRENNTPREVTRNEDSTIKDNNATNRVDVINIMSKIRERLDRRKYEERRIQLHNKKRKWWNNKKQMEGQKKKKDFISKIRERRLNVEKIIKFEKKDIFYRILKYPNQKGAGVDGMVPTMMKWLLPKGKNEEGKWEYKMECPLINTLTILFNTFNDYCITPTEWNKTTSIVDSDVEENL